MMIKRTIQKLPKRPKSLWMPSLLPIKSVEVLLVDSQASKVVLLPRLLGAHTCLLCRKL